MNKIEKDGKIAVLVSPGFGAGWSTRCDNKYAAELCMSAEFVQLVLDDKIDELCHLVEKKFEGEIYTGGAEGITVDWVPKGTAFIINEYDGSESLEYISQIEYMVA